MTRVKYYQVAQLRTERDGSLATGRTITFIPVFLIHSCGLTWA